MKPLQPVALGFLVIALRTDTAYDVFADPVGWLLVLGGLALLPDLRHHTALRALALLALAVSVPLWFPHAADALAREDESLAWAADLPGFAVIALLFASLGAAADAAGDPWAARTCRSVVSATVVVAALPVLVFGGGWADGAELAGSSAALLRLGTVVALLVYGGRAWARPRMVETPADLPDTS